MVEMVVSCRKTAVAYMIDSDEGTMDTNARIFAKRSLPTFVSPGWSGT